MERISSKDESVRMPPEGKPLTAQQIALIRRWIKQGARSPQGEQPQTDPRKHWSYQPARRPAMSPGPEPALGGKPARCVRCCTARATGTSRQPAGRQSHTVAPGVSRPHRLTTHSRGIAGGSSPTTPPALTGKLSNACWQAPSTANAGDATGWISGGIATGTAAATRFATGSDIFGAGATGSSNR